MDLLRIHLEQSSKRSKERAKEPVRVAAAAELTELHDRLSDEVKKLQNIHYERYGRRLDDLRHREMELCYELNRESWHHILMLKEARKKVYQALEGYKAKKDKELRAYRVQVGHMYMCALHA